MNLNNELNTQIKNENFSLLQLVSFSIGKEEFGVDILKVQEIINLPSITKVPNAPNFVEGVINLRGRIIPVIELRKRLGLEKKEYDNNTRIIVIELHTQTVGFIVDSVREVLRINQNIIEPPPSLTTTVDSQFISAVAKLEDRLLILLDLDLVLRIQEVEEITQHL